MEVYQGKSVFGGIAIGRISVHKKDEQQVKRVRIEDSEQEILRYRQAKQTAMEQLQGLYQKALKEVGEANAAIFEIHQMMLEDDDYNESVENIIRMQQVNAEYAVASTGDNFAQMFSAMDDDYMRARSADVKDISERVLSVLGGRATGIAASGEPVIIVADDLAPSETVQLNKDLVLSFVTVHGSVNSHTAILARTMSIPALIGTDVALDETVDGKFAVVDGTNGVLYVEPDEETLETMRRRQQEGEEIDWRSIRNEVSNENALNEKLRDDRGTNAAALNDAAAEAEARMRANREAYEQGLAEERAIREGRRGRKEGRHEDRKVKGRVTVSFSLKNPVRQSVDLSVPAYRCEGGGEVVVAIVVNRAGEVVSARVAEGGDDCMREAALHAARVSSFNIDSSAPARQQGTITYTFIPQ